jgi:hypothetical protein
MATIALRSLVAAAWTDAFLDCPRAASSAQITRCTAAPGECCRHATATLPQLARSRVVTQTAPTPPRTCTTTTSTRRMMAARVRAACATCLAARARQAAQGLTACTAFRPAPRHPRRHRLARGWHHVAPHRHSGAPVGCSEPLTPLHTARGSVLTRRLHGPPRSTLRAAARSGSTVCARTLSRRT